MPKHDPVLAALGRNVRRRREARPLTQEKLAEKSGPLAAAKFDLLLHKAAIEVCPISGKKLTTAASKAGLAASALPTLLVQGDDRPGLGYAIAQAIAEAGINVTFLVAQVVDARFSAVVGFGDEAASKQATALIKKAVKKLEK